MQTLQTYVFELYLKGQTLAAFGSQAPFHSFFFFQSFLFLSKLQELQLLQFIELIVEVSFFFFAHTSEQVISCHGEVIFEKNDVNWLNVQYVFNNGTQHYTKRYQALVKSWTFKQQFFTLYTKGLCQLISCQLQSLIERYIQLASLYNPEHNLV